MADLKTVVGFFNSRRQAEQAVSALVLAELDRDQISMLASEGSEKDVPAIGPLHEVGADTEAGRDAALGGMT